VGRGAPEVDRCGEGDGPLGSTRGGSHGLLGSWPWRRLAWPVMELRSLSMVDDRGAREAVRESE
jgi:hypothetical protein